MKSKLLLLFFLATAITVCAQEKAPSQTGDTTLGINIVERYLSMVDFQREKTDSILFVESLIVDRSHPFDTMTIYRWYMAPKYMRVEIWQDGKLDDGYYSNGTTTFKKFNSANREWMNMPQDNFVKRTSPLDIRGALYDWRSKGAEISYAGEYNYNGHMVDRVFVSCPDIFDRYYLFEKSTGLLFLLTENDRLFGDAEPAHNAVKIDWRAWGEFTPVHMFLLPSTESYQYQDQIVIMKHKYRYLPSKTATFTEDYQMKP